MNWQLLIVGILVGIAAAYLGWLTWRTWQPRKGSCGGSCGCAGQTQGAKEPSVVVVPELTVRRRDANGPG